MEIVSLTIFAALVALAWLSFRVDRGWYWILRRRLGLSDRVLREDALKYLARCEIENEPASLRGVAGSLGVGGGVTSRIVSQLADRKLLTITGGEFRLTEEGRRYGLRMIRAHRLYETYMSERTGFRGEELHERAEQAEHELTEEDMIALDRALAYPVHDPHGDPIPDPDGMIARAEGVVDLGDLPVGGRGVIVHLEDEPVAVYRRIAAAGLYPGQQIEILARDGAEVRFAAEDGEHRLPRLAATNVHVVPREEQSDAAGEPAESLAAAPVGEARSICRISPRITGLERRRLMDLGFLPGTTVVKEYVSAGGDPIAFRVRGSLMALRLAQAEHILVEAAESGEPQSRAASTNGGTP